MNTPLVYVRWVLSLCLAWGAWLWCAPAAWAQAVPVVSMDIAFCSPSKVDQVQIQRDCIHAQKQAHEGPLLAWLHLHNPTMGEQARVLVVSPYFHSLVEVYQIERGHWVLHQQGGASLGGRSATASLGGHRFVLSLPPGDTSLLVRVQTHTPNIQHVWMGLENPGRPYSIEQLLLALHLGTVLMLLLLVLIGYLVHPSVLQFRLLVLTALVPLSVVIGSGALFLLWPEAAHRQWLMVFDACNVLRLACLAWIYEAMVGPYQQGRWYRRCNHGAYAAAWGAVLCSVAGWAQLGWLLTMVALVATLSVPALGLYTAKGMPARLRRILLGYLLGLLLLLLGAVVSMVLSQGHSNLPTYITRVIDLSWTLGVVVTILLRNKVIDQEYKRTRLALDAQTVALASERQSRHEKRMLLDMLTHEIKNPLASISFAITTLSQAGEGQRDQTSRRLENISRSVETIDQIIERCNLANGIEDARIAPRLEALDLSLLLQELIDTSAQTPRLVLLAPPTPMPMVRTDPYLLRVVAANLIDNALKYALAETRIVVEPFWSEEAHGGDWGFRVSNAVEPSMMPDPLQVFERYYRHPLAQQLRGSGLGLSICRQICALLGGHISYQGQAAHATFEVRFEAD